MQHRRIFSTSSGFKPSAFKSLAFKPLAAAVLAGAGLLFSAGLATAQSDNSITMIDAGALGITSAEIANIKARMQEAVTSGHLAGSLLLVGNQDGIALLERRHAGDLGAVSCLQPGARKCPRPGWILAGLHAPLAHLAGRAVPSSRAIHAATRARSA
jgi:hypothetical protein